MDHAENTVEIGAVPLIELTRGDRVESRHLGHAVICEANGAVVEAWGNPNAMIYPRSSCKMVQALPLLESGAARDLTARQLAVACASHEGAALHVNEVRDWLSQLGLSETDLRCGSHEPKDRDELKRLTCTGDSACQLHNNCSGKHAGFLMLNQHLGGGSEYIEPDHPVQQAVKQSLEEVTGETSPGFGIDGCSAPNFATSVAGLARAMAKFASASESDTRGRAMVRLREAMMLHPDLVAGTGRACTELMRASDGRAAVKTGAEAVFVGIIPPRDARPALGIALKILDGGTRAANAAIAALLSHVGALDAQHPDALKHIGGPITNWRGIACGEIRRASGFAGG